MVDRNIDEGSLDRVWKEFGKQTPAGKLLYDLYGVRFRPERFVQYPKLKMKTKECTSLPDLKKNQTGMKQAANKIDYPDYTQNITHKISKVDLIPKRKNETVIKQELNQIKIAMTNSATKPVVSQNRKTQIETLQDKFMFQERTVMPKGARLPGLKQLEANKSTDEHDKYDKYDNSKRFTDKKEELTYLYTQIMKEIDERYVYMEEIKKLGKNKDQIIMAEIKDRLDELKKIKKMIDLNDFK